MSAFYGWNVYLSKETCFPFTETHSWILSCTRSRTLSWQSVLRIPAGPRMWHFPLLQQRTWISLQQRYLNSPRERWTFSKAPQDRSFSKHWGDFRPLTQVEKSSLVTGDLGPLQCAMDSHTCLHSLRQDPSLVCNVTSSKSIPHI